MTAQYQVPWRCTEKSPQSIKWRIWKDSTWCFVLFVVSAVCLCRFGSNWAINAKGEYQVHVWPITTPNQQFYRRLYSILSLNIIKEVCGASQYFPFPALPTLSTYHLSLLSLFPSFFVLPYVSISSIASLKSWGNSAPCPPVMALMGMTAPLIKNLCPWWVLSESCSAQAYQCSVLIDTK